MLRSRGTAVCLTVPLRLGIGKSRLARLLKGEKRSVLLTLEPLPQRRGEGAIPTGARAPPRPVWASSRGGRGQPAATHLAGAGGWNGVSDDLRRRRSSSVGVCACRTLKHLADASPGSRWGRRDRRGWCPPRGPAAAGSLGGVKGRASCASLAEVGADRGALVHAHSLPLRGGSHVGNTVTHPEL